MADSTTWPRRVAGAAAHRSAEQVVGGRPSPAKGRTARESGPVTRIGLFGQFGCGNSGNDGSLEAMLTFLRELRPNAKLTCICPAPEAVRHAYGLAGLGVGWPGTRGPLMRSLDKLLLGLPHVLASWVHSVKRVRELDLLIIPGTGMLDDFATGPWGMPYALFRWCASARLCGTRVAFVSVGAGPIHHPVSRWLLRSAAGFAQYRSYRDTVSKNFMESIGFAAENDPVYPDIAFKLPVPSSGPDRARNGPLTVGVGVMAYSGWRSDTGGEVSIYEAYLRKLTTFLVWLLDHGYHIRLLTGDRRDKRPVDDVMKAIAAQRRSGDALVAKPADSLDELMDQIARTDVVIATRFHNVVCSLMLGKPVISLGYAKKNDALLADMGLGDFCQEIEGLDVGLLIDQFTRLLAQREVHEAAIREATLSYRDRLRRQDAILAAEYL